MKETEKTLQVINIDGIDCYELNGVVYLRLETVARGLGFTQEKNGKEYIRWDRIKSYLEEFSFPICGENGMNAMGYIPENVFYRLAMKAKNEVAEKFQAKVADEIIPTIRRTGRYGSDAELTIAYARIDELENKLKSIEKIETKIDEKLDYLYYTMLDAETANAAINNSKPVTYEECVGKTRVITDKRGKINHMVHLLLETGEFDSRRSLYARIYKLMNSKRNIDINKTLVAYAAKNGLNANEVTPFEVIINVGYAYKAFVEIAEEMIEVLGADKPPVILSDEYINVKHRIATEGYVLFGLYAPLIYKKIYKKMHDEFGVNWTDYNGNGKAVRADGNLQKMFVDAFNMLLCLQ